MWAYGSSGLRIESRRRHTFDLHTPDRPRRERRTRCCARRRARVSGAVCSQKVPYQGYRTRNPNLDLELRRDSAPPRPGPAAHRRRRSLRGCCITTYEYSYLPTSTYLRVRVVITNKFKPHEYCTSTSTTAVSPARPHPLARVLYRTSKKCLFVRLLIFRCNQFHVLFDRVKTIPHGHAWVPYFHVMRLA